MKTLLFSLLFSVSLALTAQEVTTNSSKSDGKIQPITDTKANQSIVSDIKEPPEFPGGKAALLSYLAENLRYPHEIQAQGIQGKVLVDFVITRTGKVVKVKIIKSINPFLDAEAIRVVSQMPDWKPGKLNGIAVNVSFSLPLLFSLQK